MNISNNQQIIEATRRWVDLFVVEFNLCPFAKRELVKDRVRFVVSEANTDESLLDSLVQELTFLTNNESVETTLLIHPSVLNDFYQYNQFLEAVDKLLVGLGLEGIYQVASFHPNYQFSGTQPDDAENYTNRSPYPMLHLLREKSLTFAIDHYPEVGLIPERNIEHMNSLGVDQLHSLFSSCLNLSV
jgi:hypothetical protein